MKLPTKYTSILNTKETEHAIVAIKDFFQLALSTELNLSSIDASAVLIIAFAALKDASLRSLKLKELRSISHLSSPFCHIL